jgi:aminoglycoside 3-N-acetyltransferase
MISFRDVLNGLKKLELDPQSLVIFHGSLSAFGEVRGGAETILGALLASVKGAMAPTFTYKVIVTPEEGPENNGIVYGSGHDLNRMAEFYQPDMPADTLMGVLAETLRHQPAARRSSHPILSFAGVHVDEALESQTVDDPLAPVAWLAENGGWVLLLGVDHTSNTSIHYAEKKAGRRQFVRWALTPQGVRECPGFPGCSDGFEAVAPLVEPVTRRVQVGDATLQAMPLAALVTAVTRAIAADPQALLCSRPDCERCNAVRAALLPTTSEARE